MLPLLMYNNPMFSLSSNYFI